MAITYIANALGANNSTTSFSITLPATQAGDILILEYVHRGLGDATLGGTSITTDGLTWTEKHDQQFASSTFSAKTVWTRCTGNHTGKTITGSGLTNSCAAIVTQYRGAILTDDPLTAATIVGEQNGSGSEIQAQITTTVNNAWVVLVVANSPDYAVTAAACTSPTLTQRAERLSTGGTDSSIAHASGEKASAGATGSFTWTQTNNLSGSWAYAIKPDPGTARTLSGTTTINSNIVIGFGNGALDVFHAAVLSGTTSIVSTPQQLDYFFDAHTLLYDELNSSINEGSAFDANELSYANISSTDATVGGIGTAAPASGSNIQKVQVYSSHWVDVNVVGTGSLIVKYSTQSLLNETLLPETVLEWTDLSVPTGGWTWAKVQELEVSFNWIAAG